MSKRGYSRGEGNLQRVFGQNVLERRTAAGMSQEELAERAGITRGYISMIEVDDINVTLETVVVIARVLRTTPLSMLRPRRKARKTRQSG